MKVRFLLGDVDTNDQLITDEEITALLTVVPTIVYAAAACADALAAKYARQVDSTNIEISVSASRRSEAFAALAKRLRAMPADTMTTGGDGSGVVLAGITIGGRSVSTRDSLAEDTSIVQPAFSRGMFDNPGDDED